MVTKMNIALVLMTILAALPGNIVAVDHIVGDTTGWTIPSSGPTTYANWASGRTFRVGDTLVFNFASGAHDVAKVTKSAYDSCSSTNPISLITVGPANITLNSTGSEYFICTFGQHCNAGQKLAINVATSSTTSPTPAPSPVPNPTRAPTPTPSLSPSDGPSGPSPSPSGGAGDSPVSAPPPGPVTPEPTTPSPTSPGDGLVPPPAPSSASRSAFVHALIMFMSIAISIMC
ncbi:cucumber peeling cupredoxin-like [Solanum pennellii]|uniref:Cucumber peeling cupredoxin-like n=1 Tax=Solanum pennellii TaxID=28526 RepID=A0ABM1H6K5_SOLPN|nr:cucumber peeling cupredoxin-like [Solanum pennellii]